MREAVDVPERMNELATHGRRRAFGGSIHFRILGPLEVDSGGGPVALGGPKQRAVLAHLIVRANELVSAETLVDELWGEEPPENARNTIQAYVSHLRRAIGRDRIEWRAPGYILRVDASELDATRFDAVLRDAKKALPVEPSVAVGVLEEALSLWRGPALAGLADQPSLVAEATRLEDLRLEAQETRIDGLLATGAHARAIAELQVLFTHHPLREGLWARLMLALYRDGRQADALGAYQRARQTLADELGIDASPELVRLHERILRQDPGLDLRGQALRAYRLLEKVSGGPRGVVFRAIQPRVERDVAVKIFDEAIAGDPSFVRRFEQEAQAVAALEHPHIVPIYDYWREPGRAYIVSRYLRGASLRALQERGRSLERDRALRVVEQVASALAFAHGQGVAHGRVGTSNVLFDGEGNAYLGDFLVGVGPVPDARSDVGQLARLTRSLLAEAMPEPLHALVEEADLGSAPPAAEAFVRAARVVLEPAATARPTRHDEVRNPYKGLRPFTEADARDFFGRGELTQRLVGRLRREEVRARLLAVVGPSGSGKSSVVRAGLVPAIRQGALGDAEDRFVVEMSPGAHPIDELEAALLRIAVGPAGWLHEALEAGSRGLLGAVDLLAPEGSEVVLIVDQFEEVFTLCADEREREHFLESLRVATADPDSRLRVVVTLRADFYDRPLRYPRFGELFAATTEAVPPLTPDELEQAIRKPAELVGVSPEPGLVAEMIAEVAHQPGALPLLQYSLTELFERRDDHRLTLRAHQQGGGVGGALSARADRTLEAMDSGGRRAVKQVFLRLVTLGEGTQDTRRRVVRSELDALEVKQEAIDGVLDAFGRHRFLTFDRDPSTREPTVEIAHEALLIAWGRLSGWIDEMREDLRQERQLARGAAEWRASDHDPSFLLRGTRLEQLASWAEATDLAIGRAERGYLKASMEARERERAEDEARRERELRTERRSRTRLRALVAVLGVAALVAGSLTIIATSQSGRAEREARVASARELAAAAVSNLDVDPERSILLAMEAIRRTRSVDGTVLPEAEEALHLAIGASRVVRTLTGLGGAVAWSPRGVVITEGPEGTGIVDIRDAETGEAALPAFKGHEVDINDVAFDPTGTMLATTGDDGALRIWDPETGSLIMEKVGSGAVIGPSFNAEGSLVAAAWTDESLVRVFDVSTGRLTMKYQVRYPSDTSLSPDGTQVAVSSWHGAAFAVNVKTGRRTALYIRNRWWTEEVAWSPDGRYVATADGEYGGSVFDAATGVRKFVLPSITFTVSVAWDPTGTHTIVAGQDSGSARVWRLGRFGVTEVAALPAQEMRAGIAGVAFSPDGTEVMAGDYDGRAVKVWDLSVAGDEEVAHLPAAMATISDVEFMPDGRRVVAHSPDGAGVTVWNLATREPVHEFGPPWPARTLNQPTFEVSPDGHVIAMTYRGEVTVRDVRTEEKLFVLGRGYDVTAIDWSPDGERLVVGTQDGSATVVDRTGQTIRVLRDGRDLTICSARFSPDGASIATGECGDGTGEPPRVTIWNWQSGRVVNTIDVGLTNLTFDPSGRRLAAIDSIGSVAEIWDIATRRRLVAVAGHSGLVNDVAFSPDGSRVATVGSDGTTRVYDAASGEQQLVLRGSRWGPLWVDFSPDGTMLATGAHREVRVWALDIDDLLRIAHRELTRELTDDECRQYVHIEKCPAG